MHSFTGLYINVLCVINLTLLIVVYTKSRETAWLELSDDSVSKFTSLVRARD